MQAMKVRVGGGRIRLDEPTNLPDGSEVELFIAGEDDPDERAALHASIEDAERELDAGQGLAEQAPWEKLRALR